jgi:type I restriction enzyme S subunit
MPIEGQHWLSGTLGEFVTFLSGGTPAKEWPDYWSGDIPWLTPKDMKQSLVEQTTDNLTASGVAAGSRIAPIEASYVVVRGMILAHTFPVSRMPRPGAFNQDIKAIVPGPLVRPAYLSCWLRGFAADFLRLAGDSTHGTKKLDLRDLTAFPITLPSQREQDRVVEILDGLDDQTSAVEQTIGKLVAVRNGLLHDLMTRGIATSGSLRPPATIAGSLYETGPCGVRPLGWEVGLLDAFATRGSGHTPSKSNPMYWNGGIKWVSLSDSSKLDRFFITDTDKEISEAGLANSSAVLHPAGTVVLSRDAGVGKSAILSQPMAVSQHFMAWRVGERLDNVYLYYWLQFMKRVFEAIALGSTIQTIGLSYFRKLHIAIPPIAEQAEIAKCMRQSDCAIERAREELSALNLLKIGLTADLLTGRVRVPAEIV